MIRFLADWVEDVDREGCADGAAPFWVADFAGVQAVLRVAIPVGQAVVFEAGLDHPSGDVGDDRLSGLNFGDLKLLHVGAENISVGRILVPAWPL